MKKKIILGILILSVLVIIVGLGPIFITFIAKKITYPLRPKPKEILVPLYIKVKGKIHQEGNILFLVSEEKKQPYVLIGEKVNELRNYVGKDLTVFGRIKKANPLGIKGWGLVACNIDVSKYGETLEIGKPAVEFAKLQELRRKIEEKRKLKEEILAKAGKQKEERYEVIDGHFYIQKIEKKEWLLFLTKDNDKYFFVGKNAESIKTNFDEYKDKEFILICEVVIPNEFYPEKDVIPARILEVYDENKNLVLK